MGDGCALEMRAMHDRFMRHRPSGYERNAAVRCICTGVIRAYLCGKRKMPCGPRLTAESVSRFVTISAACADSERWRTLPEARLLAAGVFYVMLKMDNLLSDRPSDDWVNLCKWFEVQEEVEKLPTVGSVEVAILTHVDWNVCSPQTVNDWVRVLGRGASYFEHDASSNALRVQLDAATLGRCHPASIALAAVMVSGYRVSSRVVKLAAVATGTTPRLMWSAARRIARVNGQTRRGLRSEAREGDAISSSSE